MAILCHVRSPVKQALRRCTVVNAQEAHNRYRANHGAANLEWSDECYLSAKKQANACQEKLDLIFCLMLNSFKYGFTMFQCFTMFHYFHGMLWLYVICASLSYTQFCWVHSAIVAWHWVFLVTMSRVFLSRFHFRTAFNRSSAPCERADHFHRFRCRCSIRLTIPSPRIPKEPLSNNVFY